MPQMYASREKEERVTAVYYNGSYPQKPSRLPSPNQHEIEGLNDNQRAIDERTMHQWVVPKWRRGKGPSAVSTPAIAMVLYPPIGKATGVRLNDEDMQTVLHYYAGDYEYEPGVFKIGFARFAIAPSSDRLGAANITSTGSPSTASEFVKEVTNGEIQINLPAHTTEALVAALYFHADWPKEGSDQPLETPDGREIQGFRVELTPYDAQYKTFTYANQQFMALKVRTKRQDISAVYIFPAKQDSYGNFVYDFDGAAAYKRLLGDYDKVNEEVFRGHWQNFSTQKVVLYMPSVKVLGNMQTNGGDIRRIYGVTDGGNDIALIVSSMYEQGSKGITGASGAAVLVKGFDATPSTAVMVNGPFMAAVVKKGLGDEYPLMWVNVRESDFQPPKN